MVVWVTAQQGLAKEWGPEDLPGCEPGRWLYLQEEVLFS